MPSSSLSTLLSIFVTVNLLISGTLGSVPTHPQYPDLYEASIAELQSGIDDGNFTSVDLVKARAHFESPGRLRLISFLQAYLARIEEVNLRGPKLRAVLETNLNALTDAAALDTERFTHGKRGPLHGIPILLKDSIATVASEGMNTTAGSYALLNSVVPRDAGVVKYLRQAGAIILGKTNMCEWAHARGDLASGWSARGGQSTNPYYPKGDPCGSSSGSGIATAIGLAAATLGTETHGSITCPSSWNNIVGIKPTVGLTSRAGVIPVTEHQDTIGPMARTVADAAALLSVIAGPDPHDNYTYAHPYPAPDYRQALNKDALKGKRIGVPRKVFLNNTIIEAHESVFSAFHEALHLLKQLGATIVDPADLPSAEELSERKFILSNSVEEKVKFKLFISGDRGLTYCMEQMQLNAYLSKLHSNPSGVRTITDLIKFNDDNVKLEKPPGYEDQSTLIRADATTGRNRTYWESYAQNLELGGSRGIDAALKHYNLDALVLPGVGYSASPSALAGYPTVSVPLGFHPENTPLKKAGPETFYPTPGMPFGLLFLADKWSEFKLIGFAYAYEQATQTRLKRKAYRAAIPKTQLHHVIKGVAPEAAPSSQVKNDMFESIRLVTSYAQRLMNSFSYVVPDLRYW